MNSLVKGILAGDSQAVSVFYTQYAPKVRKYMKTHLPESEDAEAFVNDVFLQAIDSLPLFQGKSSLATWLYTIAHNNVVDYYRKKKIKSVLLSQIPFLEIVAQEVYEPEFQFEKNKLQERIETTFKKMSAKYRQILRLRYEENKSVKEIALILHLSPKATESLLYRARQDFINVYAKG